MRLVQTRAERRSPDATTAASSVTSRAGAARASEAVAHAEPGEDGAGQAHADRRGAEERAHVGHPADQERHALAERGAGEDDRPAVLVEAPPERRERERGGQQREAGEREDGDRTEARSARGHGGRHEEDADADDPVEAQGQQLERPHGARVRLGRLGTFAAS